MPTLPTLTAQEFVARWRATTLSERSSYQQHFLDLCRLIGHPTPAEVDPDGTSFTFEAGATKQIGRQGWADVWKKGAFAWEYKGRHANLDKAYQQLLQYRESLQNPPLLVVCDLDQIIIHTNFTNTVKQVTTLTLDDLLTPPGLARLRNVFDAPDAFRAPQTTAQVTEAAAREFARLADLLRKWGEQPQRIAHFLIRLLFCLFAEDVGLLPNALFSRLVAQTRTRPPLFAAQLRQLFATMATGGFFGMEDVPHINGRLFDDDTVLDLDSDGLDILAKVSQLDWSSIEPSILGTLFERSLDPSKRAQLGAHYTSRDDILLIIEPVLMAPLRRRWEAVRSQAQGLAARRDESSGAPRTKAEGELRHLLTGFAHEIASTRVLDPAAGSANFLYVALKQLLDLEKEVITFAGDISVGRFFPSVSPEQLRGIEINEYAHELAQITVWIGYIQWLRDNGFGLPSEPILKPLDTIRHMDALLHMSESGAAEEPEWPEADVIVGNPPFLGAKKMRIELGDTYVDALRHLYEGRVPKSADFVTYWFERARALVESKKVKRSGLLATQSIRGDASRPVIDRIKQTGDIFMAWNDRPWILDGADVRVSMIGFDNGDEQQRTLNGVVVASINTKLSTTLDLTTAHRLPENQGLCFMGNIRGGDFDLPNDVAQKMLKAPLNPNGRPNSDVVLPWVNALDITDRPRNKWIISFGVDMPEDEAALYELPFAHVEKYVKAVRQQNNRAAYRKRWWIHMEARPGMWAALSKLKRYIVTPVVSKHRVFFWLDVQTMPDARLYVIAREEDYFFGLLHSHIHELWSLANPARHGVGNDPVYNNTTTFETFPFPFAPGTERADDPRVAAIAAAARRLVELRDNWLNPSGASVAELKTRTLTNLYNAPRARRGSRWRTPSSTRRCAPPTAGRPTSAMQRCWRGCSRSTGRAQTHRRRTATPCNAMPTMVTMVTMMPMDVGAKHSHARVSLRRFHANASPTMICVACSLDGFIVGEALPLGCDGANAAWQCFAPTSIATPTMICVACSLMCSSWAKHCHSIIAGANAAWQCFAPTIIALQRLQWM